MWQSEEQPGSDGSVGHVEPIERRVHVKQVKAGPVSRQSLFASQVPSKCLPRRDLVGCES